MDIGCRVVRGPDWEWDDQDGGEGSLGVVVEVDKDIKGTVWVQWETGRRANYRAGFEGKMDLTVFSSSGAGKSEHYSFNRVKASCSSCQSIGKKLF